MIPQTGLARHYTTLKLPFGASEGEVKKAFLKLSMTHHPDKGGDLALYQDMVGARDEILKSLQR